MKSIQDELRELSKRSFGGMENALWLSAATEIDRLTAELAAAQAQLAESRKNEARYLWLCDKFSATKLPCAIERILEGSYIADGKASIDAAIDAAKGE